MFDHLVPISPRRGHFGPDYLVRLGAIAIFLSLLTFLFRTLVAFVVLDCVVNASYRLSNNRKTSLS